jgi:hypothetical protein
MELIASAAVKVGGVVFFAPRPARHGDVLWLLGDDLAIYAYDQGFKTSEGRYVQRREARRIAETAGQLLPSAIKHVELFSEDVW